MSSNTVSYSYVINCEFHITHHSAPSYTCIISSSEGTLPMTSFTQTSSDGDRRLRTSTVQRWTVKRDDSNEMTKAGILSWQILNDRILTKKRTMVCLRGLEWPEANGSLVHTWPRIKIILNTSLCTRIFMHLHLSDWSDLNCWAPLPSH